MSRIQLFHRIWHLAKEEFILIVNPTWVFIFHLHMHIHNHPPTPQPQPQQPPPTSSHFNNRLKHVSIKVKLNVIIFTEFFPPTIDIRPHIRHPPLRIHDWYFYTGRVAVHWDVAESVLQAIVQLWTHWVYGSAAEMSCRLRCLNLFVYISWDCYHCGNISFGYCGVC